MNIILINGSPRSRGATAEILRKFETALRQRGAEVEFVQLSALSVQPCSGCCACYQTGRCAIPDDAEALSAQIAQADGVIVGSPTYASNISGQLKTFVDRGHFVIEQLLHNKYAISVVTGENYGSRDAGHILAKLLRYSGARLSGSLVCDLPFNSGAEPLSRLDPRISALAGRLVRDVAGRTPYRFQSLLHRVIFFAGIRPFVRKKGEKYAGVTRKWAAVGLK